MARVKIVRESGRLMVVEIVGERFPVLPERPEVLSHIGHIETLEDGRKIATGLREVGGVLRNVAWRADADEVAKVNREWREAVEHSSVEIADDPIEI